MHMHDTAFPAWQYLDFLSSVCSYADNPNLCTNEDSCQTTKGNKSKLAIYVAVPMALVVVALTVLLCCLLLRRNKRGNKFIKHRLMLVAISSLPSAMHPERARTTDLPVHFRVSGRLHEAPGQDFDEPCSNCRRRTQTQLAAAWEPPVHIRGPRDDDQQLPACNWAGRLWIRLRGLLGGWHSGGGQDEVSVVQSGCQGVPHGGSHLFLLFRRMQFIVPVTGPIRISLEMDY